MGAQYPRSPKIRLRDIAHLGRMHKTHNILINLFILASTGISLDNKNCNKV